MEETKALFYQNNSSPPSKILNPMILDNSEEQITEKEILEKLLEKDECGDMK